MRWALTVVAALTAADARADGVYVGRAAGEDSARVAVVVGGGRFIAYACSAEQTFNEAYSRWFEGSVGEDGAIAADAANLRLRARLSGGRIAGELGGEFAKTQTFTAAKVADSASAGLYRLTQLDDDSVEVFGWIADEEGDVVGAARKAKRNQSAAGKAKINGLKANGQASSPKQTGVGLKTSPKTGTAKSKSVRTLPSGKKKIPQELTADVPKKRGAGGGNGAGNANAASGKNKNKTGQGGNKNNKNGGVANNNQNDEDAANGAEKNKNKNKPGQGGNKNNKNGGAANNNQNDEDADAANGAEKKNNKNKANKKNNNAAEAVAEAAEDIAAAAALNAANRAGRAAEAAEDAAEAAEAAEENAAQGQKVQPQNLVRKKPKAADVLPGEEVEAALVGVDEEERVLTVDDGEEVKEIALGDRQAVVTDPEGNRLIEQPANAKAEKKLSGGVASMLKKMAKSGKIVVKMKMGANSVVVKPAE